MPISIGAADNAPGRNHVGVANGAPRLKERTHAEAVSVPEPALFKQHRSRADEIAIARNDIRSDMNRPVKVIGIADDASCGDSGPPLQDILIPLATPISYSLLLLLALPAAFGAFWLVLRRKYDDYGRDHYNVTLPWCAAWARNAWLALWLLMLAFNGLNVYDRWQNGVFTSYDALLQSIPLLLWLIPPLLWAVVSSSKTPLRHKFSLALALLLSIAYLLPFTLEVATPSMPDAVLWEWPLQDLAPDTLQENPLPEPELPQQELPAPDVPEGEAPEAGQTTTPDAQPAAPQQEKP